MLEAEQILGGGDQELRVVAELADASVAAIAEKFADGFGAVVVIDVQLQNPTVANPSLRLFADGALILLSLHHLIVLFARQFVGLFEMVLAKILAAFLGCVSIARQGVDVVPIILGQVLAGFAILFDVALAAGTVFRNACYALIVTLFANELGDVLLRKPRSVALALVLPIRRALFGCRFRPLLSAGLAAALSTVSVVQRANEIFIVAVFADIRACFHRPILSTFVAYNKVVVTA